MSIHCWNVHGLGKASKKKLVKCSIQDSSCDIVCLQEKKLQQFNEKLLKSTYRNNFDCWDEKASIGSCGGLLTCWKSSCYSGTPFHKGPYSISTLLQKMDNINNQQCLITNTYGPSIKQDLKSFFDEHSDLRKRVHSPWIILGDFNITHYPEDRHE